MKEERRPALGRRGSVILRGGGGGSPRKEGPNTSQKV